MKHASCFPQRLSAALLALALAVGFAPAAPAQEEETSGKSPPEALTIFADAANFQNNQAYELAVEEWQKFLESYPNDALAPKARHYLGVSQLQLKQYDKAAEAFAAVLENHPDFELAEDALLNLGWSQYSLAGPNNTEKYEQAAATFEKLLERFPEGKYVDQALFFRGESLYALGQKQAAVEAYNKLIANYPKSPLRRDAVYAVGVTREELGQYEEAGEIYDYFLENYPQDELITEIRMRKAETLLQDEQFQAAEQMFAEAASVEGFASAGHARMRQAYAAARQGDDARAAQLYAQVVENHPQTDDATEASMSAGRMYYRAGEYDKAAEWLQKALAAEEPSPEAAHWLARIHLRNNEPRKAAEAASQALPEAGGSEWLVPLKMDHADALDAQQESREEGLALYEQIAAEHAEHELAPQALYNAAFAALELKKYEQALEKASAFQNAYPQDDLAPDVLQVAAEATLQQGDYAAAEQHFRELLENHPRYADAPKAKVRLGLALYLQKKYDQTASVLAPALSQLQAPELKAEAQYLTGVSQYYLKDYEAAAEALEVSYEADPNWRQADEALLYLSRAQRRRNQLDAARATAEKLLEEYPETGLADRVYYRLGEYAYAAGDYQAAAEQYDQSLAADSGSTYAPYALYGKGWALLKDEQYEGASEAFTKLLENYGEHQLAADAYFARAMSRRQSGDQQGAVDDIAAFLKTEPAAAQKADALYERALAEVALEQYARAVDTLTALLDAQPDYAAADKALYELGWAYKSLDQQEQAADAFARLAENHAESPLAAEANFHVGENRYAAGNYEQAAQAYRAALAKAKDAQLGEKAAYKLAWSLYQQEQFEEAGEQFAAQLEKYPQGELTADARFMRAEALFEQQQYADALPIYLAAHEGEAPSETIGVLTLLHGGQSAAQVEQWDQALSLLSQIPAEYPESPYLAEANYERGFVKQKQGAADEALKLYEQAASQSRGAVGARARFMRGELYFTQKNFDEALKEFQRVMFGFGGDQAAEDVKPWQAKAGYEAGRVSDVLIGEASSSEERMKRIADARRFYGYVVEKHPQDQLAAQAKKRVSELAKLN